jgi:Cu/Zn superoxide dismutase
MTTYPNQSSPSVNITGTVLVTQNTEGNVTTFSLNLSGFTEKCNCTSETCDNITANTSVGTPGACGAHIHEGTDCNDSTHVAGHFFGNGVTTDPWDAKNGAFYNT